ncbi:MAG TPA: hypothetical protein VGC76_14475 [Pyrinomonadaceae bacterium]|jgi:hypothetical protein
MRTPIYNNKLQLFVEADELSGASGAAVSSFTDLSGNGRHLTQDAARPVIETGAVNGKKAVVWDGSKNALSYSGNFQITSGFIVAEIASFTNYNGLLTTLSDFGILVGNHHDSPNWFDFGYEDYEVRLNDRIYPDSAAPAPIGSWGIIFFRFWRALQCDGIQLGSDRGFSGRKLNGKVAMMALYDRGWCEREIRNMFQSIAYAYQLPIANVFPFLGSKTDNAAYSKKVLSDGQNEPVLRVKRGIRKSFDLNFTSRSTREFRTARSFWNEYYPAKSFLFRDYNTTPPEDTITRIPENTEFEDRGSGDATVRKNYGFSGVETSILSPGAIPASLPETTIAGADTVIVVDDMIKVGSDVITAGGYKILI